MTTMDLEILTPTERDRSSVGGRRARARRPSRGPLARKLAARFDVDLHVASSLICEWLPTRTGRTDCFRNHL